MLADYYCDKDPLVRGIIKEVYAPFSMSGGYRLTGVDEKDRKAYMEYYKRINLEQVLRSVFLQYYKYANVYLYVDQRGLIKTMPVRKMRIGNVAINGTPLVEFDCINLITDMKARGYDAEKGYIKDDEVNILLGGYPDEIIDGVRRGKQWVQLNPKNAKVIQDAKEDWTRYAYPMITACLSALAKKELISEYEDATLNLGSRGFIQAKYGDPDNKVLPDRGQLQQLDSLVRKAMTKTSLATTNNWADIKFIQADTRFLYESQDKYKSVNNDILSAGGISGIIVSGVSQDTSTFASAQVSLDTADIRIRQARAKVEQVMNEINQLALERGVVRAKKAAEFKFRPLDLKNSTKFQETCMELWKQGVVSIRTLMETSGFDMEQERERLLIEKYTGDEKLMRPKDESEKVEESTGQVGRPPVGDYETDKAKSISGKQPKPSTAE